MTESELSRELDELRRRCEELAAENARLRGENSMLAHTGAAVTPGAAREAHLRTCVEQAPAGIAMFDRDMRYLAASRRWRTAMGIENQDFVGELHYALLPETPEHWKAAHRRALGGATEKCDEDRFDRADGRTYWLRWEAQPWHEQGSAEPGGILLYFEDITERKQAQLAAHKSEAQLRAILDSMFVFVALLSPEGVYLDVNEAPLKASRRRRADVIGAAFVDQDAWRNPASRAQVRDALTRAACGETVRQDVIAHVADRAATFDITVGPIRNEAGEVVQIVVSGVDVTARNEAFAAVRATDARLRLAVDASHIGLWDWDLVTDGVYFSPEWKRLLGHEDQEIENNLASWVSRIHPDDVARALSTARAKVAEPSSSSRLEFRMRHKDGSYRWFQGQSSVLTDDATGRPIRMLGFNLDITERKLAEEELRSSKERLASLTRQLITVQEAERRSVARELHDEIGQVLTAVHLGLQQVRSAAPDASEQLDECERIVALGIAQVRSVALDLRPPMLDDLGLVPALRWYLHRVQMTGSPEIVSDLHSNGEPLPPELSIACYRIVQEAFTNIQRHAQARHAWVELRQDAGQVTILVRDDGVGMDVAAALAATGLGRSFGLVSVRERLQLLGGELTLESLPGKGTTLRARLPIVVEPDT